MVCPLSGDIPSPNHLNTAAKPATDFPCVRTLHGPHHHHAGVPLSPACLLFRSFRRLPFVAYTPPTLISLATFSPNP